MTKKLDINVSKAEALIKSWKNRKDYKGYDRSRGSSYNSWRAIVYTIKGNKIGFPETWKDYNVFMKEIQGIWEKNKIVCRINKKLPHSNENSFWAEKTHENVGKLVTLEYNGETFTLIEWAEKLNMNYQGIRQRYYKSKNLTIEEILFGKKKVIKKDINRDKKDRLIHMLNAYKLSDKRKGYEYNLDLQFAENLIKNGCKYCGDNVRIGLDRIDNNKGHTKDNVVPCCYVCNCTRMNNFSYEEMIILGETIKQIKQWRLK